MRTVGLVTVGRSDWGIYRAVARRIRDDDGLDLRIYVSGTHLGDGDGHTIDEIEADGFAAAATVPLPAAGGEPLSVGLATAAAVAGFAAVFAEERPDVLLVLGDRYEMLAAVVASLPFAIPVAHVHGGESTEGLIDEAIRHAITKMSHLHFASTETYARRIVQMGERPSSVIVSGAPGLDALLELDPLTDDELAERHGIVLDDRTLLVTYHPVTLQYEDVEANARELVAALTASGCRIVATYPNADTRGRAVLAVLEELASDNAAVTLVPSLGSRAYLTLLRRAAAMVGNSSSGIIEAATFGLPVVNVGVRQQGRIRSENVIDVGDGRDEVLAGIQRALSPGFRASLEEVRNPYGDGGASERIVEVLKSIDLGPELLVKRFHDLEQR